MFPSIRFTRESASYDENPPGERHQLRTGTPVAQCKTCVLNLRQDDAIVVVHERDV